SYKTPPPVIGSKGSARADVVFANVDPSAGDSFGATYVAVDSSELANTPPVAVLAGTPTSGPPPLAVTFDGSASNDPDSGDGLAAWRLDFGDGTAPAVGTDTPPSAIPHVYNSDGAYTARLTVTDTMGAAGSASKALTVGNVPAPGGPAKEFFFAEGTTRSDFDEFILLSNPNATAANVTLRYEK